MAIVSFAEMLHDADKRHYAVPMFDVSNLTMMRAAVEVAEELNSPVMLAAIPVDIDGKSLDYWVNSALYAANQVKVPVCLHLDHSSNLELCVRCAQKGFQSVMIDASADPFEENIAKSREVVDAISKLGVAVEAELGHVASGITGAENGMSENGHSDDCHTIFTDPASVAEFIERTRVDALAVSIGTTHGVYVSAPELNIPLWKELKKSSAVPLVLHGGSGTPEDQLREAIKEGISKINIYSELTSAWNLAMKNFLNSREEMTCYFSVATKQSDAAMRAIMREKIMMFNSNNKF